MDLETIDKLMRLSQLELGVEERDLLMHDLEKIVAMIDAMSAVDTEGVEPLAHPVDVDQPLRPDVVSSIVDRDLFQALSESTADGFYLVPRVVE